MRRILLSLLFVFSPLAVMAQKAAKDSVFRLVRADEAMLVTEDGVEYRKVSGDAKFFHNKTWILCDSASWNLSANIIDAWGNVKIKQEGTTITSETLTYVADDNLAMFYGPLVQLTDKEGNTLRTQHLDYNTKDSLAVFEEGGAMKDKDGNVIESENGEYDSKIKVFVFEKEVKLYMDSIFLKTDRLDYLSDSSKAFFGPGTKVWKDDGYIRSEAGWYSREDTTVCFQDNVYGHDETYEFWTDELYYYKPKELIEMFKRTSILDTVHSVAIVSDYLRHEKDSAVTYLYNNPAVIYYGSNDKGKIDTLFLRADTLVFKNRHKYDFTSEEISQAEKRRSDVEFDALGEYRAKLANERRQKMETALREAGKLPPLPADSTTTAPAGNSDASTEETPPVDAAPADSSGVQSLAPQPAPLDSTPVNIIEAFPNFKMYREDMQAASDSLIFTDLDSIAVLLGRPIMWNTGKNQLTSNVMHLLIKDGDVEKGSMIDDARITSEEAVNCYNQIKSTEMMGFFQDNELYRYDALGNVNAILYMEENNELTNINVKESKSLTSLIKNGKATRMLYLEEIKSDAFPIPDLEEDKRKMKGFEWRIEERPVCRDSITTRPVPRSWRTLFPGKNKPEYKYTDKYFDHYMTNVYESIRQKKAAERWRRLADEAIGKANSYADSLFSAEILLLEDSLRIADSTYLADSVIVKASATETVKPAKDSTSVKSDTPKVEKKLSPKERREIRRAERKARREARRAERKARREAKKGKREVNSRPQVQPQN